jgi:hypothetical protein
VGILSLRPCAGSSARAAADSWFGSTCSSPIHRTRRLRRLPSRCVLSNSQRENVRRGREAPTSALSGTTVAARRRHPRMMLIRNPRGRARSGGERRRFRRCTCGLP